jgi:hypothetical protein
MEEELRVSEEADRRHKEEERQRALALTNVAEGSPLAESQPALAVPDAATPSPYPDEEVYPPVVATEESQAISSEPQAEKMEPQATTPESQAIQPVIQPPSTGETVPAGKHWHLQEELAALDPGQNDGKKNENPPQTEQTAPHA